MLVDPSQLDPLKAASQISDLVASQPYGARDDIIGAKGRMTKGIGMLMPLSMGVF